MSPSAPTVLAASILAAALMSGCTSDPPGPEPCEAQRGYLQVCALYFGDPAEGSVLIRVDPQDDMPIESLFGTDGCTTVELSPGSHEWSAQHLTDTCESPYESVTIGACEEVTEVSVELGDWCMDGR